MKNKWITVVIGDVKQLVRADVMDKFQKDTAPRFGANFTGRAQVEDNMPEPMTFEEAKASEGKAE